MKVKNLKHKYYLFGNKGNVWNNNAHIAKSGEFSGVTLCKTPMLSTNWAEISKLEEANCEECNKVYKELTNGIGKSKPNPENGEKLFKALRVLEIAFLNDGKSVQTSVEALLREHKVPWIHEMSKYLRQQSIIKEDPNSVRNKKFYYNGPKLSVRYCNDLYIQMKLDNTASNEFDRKSVVKNEPVINAWEKAIKEVEVYLLNAKAQVKKIEDVLEYLKSKL